MLQWNVKLTGVLALVAVATALAALVGNFTW